MIWIENQIYNISKKCDLISKLLPSYKFLTQHRFTKHQRIEINVNIFLAKYREYGKRIRWWYQSAKVESIKKCEARTTRHKLHNRIHKTANKECWECRSDDGESQNCSKIAKEIFPLETEACIEDDGWEDDVEENFRIKSRLQVNLVEITRHLTPESIRVRLIVRGTRVQSSWVS